MAKKICLISDLHLCINPRVWKEAFLYERLGYEVVVLTQWITDDFLERDIKMLKGHAVRYESFLDMRPGTKFPASRFFFRVRKRLAGEMQKRLGIGSTYAVSYAPDLLLRRAAMEKADLYVGHTEVGFFAGRRLHDLGYRVAFDMEDWHSEDYLVPERPVSLLRRYEAYALDCGVFCTFPSKAMAEAVREKYGSRRPVEIIYNSFPDNETGAAVQRFPETNVAPLRMIWTSRTIGPGRGLETLLPAIAQVKVPLELHLLGKCPDAYRRYLEDNWRGGPDCKLVFLDFIPHHAMQETISRYDLGLAIEQTYPESRNKTVTNKILQYLQAGIKVLATNTDGQLEIARAIPEGVYLVSPDHVDQWSSQLRKAYQEKEHNTGRHIRHAYQENFSWTKQEQKLAKLVHAELSADHSINTFTTV